MVKKHDSALVLVGHGSTINPDSSAPVWEYADRIRERNVFGEVQCCFWKEEPSMRDVFRTVDSNDIYIVPAFISEGYFTETVIPRELGLAGGITVMDGRKFKYCEPVGNHPRMTDVLLHRAREVAPGIPEEQTTLLITGHGTALNDNSAKAAKFQAAKLRELTRYAAVLNTYMEEPPLVSAWHELAKTPYVVVVPFFIADGLHSYQDIPVMLGIEAAPTAAASQRDVFRNNPYALHGKQLYYAAAIGTDPLVPEVILDLVKAFDEKHGT
jgi:sirohydrochlorin cobaltochelatase